MDTDIVKYRYELEDGQVIEIFQGDDLPYPLLISDSTLESSRSLDDQQDSTIDYTEQLESINQSLESILLRIADFNDDLREQNNNITSCFLFISGVLGIIVGFLAAKELFKIWLV